MLILTKTDVALQDHVSHERWNFPFSIPRSLTQCLVFPSLEVGKEMPLDLAFAIASAGIGVPM